MPEFVKASVTIDDDNASSWSIPISSGNLYQAIGELRREVLAYYGGIVPNAQAIEYFQNSAIFCNHIGAQEFHIAYKVGYLHCVNTIIILLL